MSNNTSAPLLENEHVKELVGLFREHNIDAKALTTMLGCVAAVEKQLEKTAGELTSMRRELSVLREERNHPIRTALLRSINSLETAFNNLRVKLETLKTAIINGCKSCVSAFKQQGLAALADVSRHFNLKAELRDWGKSLNGLIKANEKAAENIETIGKEYHSAGLHVKNAARVLIGKEPLREIKRNGRLAWLAKAPFVAVRNFQQYAKNGIEQAATALERLEQSSPKRTSITQDIRKYKEMAERSGHNAPERTRAREASI